MKKSIPDDTRLEPTYGDTTFAFQRMGMALVKGGSGHIHSSVARIISENHSFKRRVINYFLRFVPTFLRKNILDRREERELQILSSYIESRNHTLSRKDLASWLRGHCVQSRKFQSPADNPFVVLADILTRD